MCVPNLPAMKCLKRIRKRLGRCYELAFKVMLDEPGAETFALVHGYVHMHGHALGHAWIETGDGRVYDTGLDRYMPRDEYAAERGAVIERRYTRMKAVQLAADTGNYGGPWHTSARYLPEPLPPGYLRQQAPPDSKAFRRPPPRPQVT
jgi:hypothetical protein